MTKGLFIIAEAGVNHNGSLATALKLVDAAARAGADAVKFQTFHAEELATEAAPKARYQKARDAGTSQLEMLKRLELSEAAHRALVTRCRRRGIMFLSTPFDERSADFLARVGMPMFKIPSGELTNHPFLRYLARKRRPLLLSTGMSTMGEVVAAVAAIHRESPRADVTLLHCVSAYPAPVEDTNLRAIDALAARFRLPVGYSDHTLGVAVAIGACARGAAVIEKHFTLDKSMKGPDHAMSLSPRELTELVAGCRQAAAALGDGIKTPRPCELELRRVARRSVVLARPVAAGTRLRAEDLACKRPGTGIPPFNLARVVGRRLKRSLPADALLSWKLLR